MRDIDPSTFTPNNKNSRYGDIKNQSNRKQNITNKLRETNDYARTLLQQQWELSKITEDIFLGSRYSFDSVFRLSSIEQRRRFNFNICAPVVELISGWQRRNRKSSICIPTTPSGQKGADIFTKCLFYLHKSTQFHTTLSHAFEYGSLVKGLGFMYFYLDYINDPINGEIKCKYLDFHRTIIDPYFRKPDMSDANFFWTRTLCTKEAVLETYNIFKEKDLPSPTSVMSDKFYYMPENFQSGLQKNLYALDEYFYKSRRKAKFVINRKTGDAHEIMGTDEVKEEVLNKIQYFSEDAIIVKDKSVPTIRRALFINGKLFEDKERPMGLDCYPVVPVLGHFSPDSYQTNLKFKGVLHDMIDLQYLYNRLKLNQFQELESQQQGLKVKQGALTNPSQSTNTAFGNVLVVNKNAQMSDIEKMPIIPPNPVTLEMAEALKKEGLETGGASEELLGISVEDKSGLLNAIKQNAGLTRNQKLIDNLDYTQNLCSDLFIKLVQNNWTVNKIKTISNEELPEEFYNKFFTKFSIKVVLGVETESQMQFAAQQLIYARDQLGIPISSQRILESLQIQNKEDIIKEVQEAEQQQQQGQQMQAAISMEQEHADTETKKAFSEAERAKAQERLAKAQKNLADAQKVYNEQI